MGRPEQYLGEGNMTLLGGIVSEIGLEMPDFNSAKEWEDWLDFLVEKYVVQVTKYSWMVVENKEQFLKDREFDGDEEEGDDYDTFVFDMSSF